MGLRDKNKRCLVTVLLSLIYSLYLTILKAEHFLSIRALGIFLLSFILMVSVLGFALKKIGERKKEKKKERKSAFAKTDGKRFFLYIFGAIVLAEFILWLALFPGIFGYDSYKQMEFYTGAEAWSTHHPVFHTWLLGTLLSAGKAVFDSFNAGVALYCFLQMILISAVYAYMFAFLRSRGVPPVVLVTGLLYLMVSPAIQLLGFNTTKDTLFGACFLLFLIELLRVALKDGGRGHVILFLLSGLLSCLLRNQGVYVIAVLFAGFLIMELSDRWKKDAVTKGNGEGRKMLLVGLAMIVVLTKLFDFACTGIFHLQKGEVREMLSVPMQQTAAVLIADRGGNAVLSNDEREIAKTLLEDEVLDVYEADTADPVKGRFSSAQFQAYRDRYLKNYAAVGLKNPGIYADAWLDMIRPYWDMSLAGYRGLMAEYTGACRETWGIGEQPLIPFVGKALKVLAVCDDYRHVPFISWLFNPGLYIFAATTVLIAALVYRKKAALIVVIPGLLYFCTLLLGPVALVRYLYPLLLSLPLVVGMLFDDERRDAT